MALVVNPLVHKHAKLDRVDFLKKLADLEAVPLQLYWPVSVYVTSHDEFQYLQYLQDAVRHGNFDGLDGYYGSGKTFGVVVGPRLLTWIQRCEVDTMQRQIIVWLAGRYWSSAESQEIMRGQLFGPVRDEVLRLQDQYFKMPYPTGDFDRASSIYHAACVSYTGANPPGLLEKLLPPAFYLESGEWWMKRPHGVDPHDVVVERMYLSSRDWDDMLKDGEPPDFIPSKEDIDLWQQWKVQYGAWEERKTPVYSLFRADPELGSVYLIRERGTDLYKIGYTQGEPVNRLAQLQTGNSAKLELVGSFAVVGRSTESTLHELFSRHRRSGEWFQLLASDVESVLDPAWRRDNNIF